MRILPYHWATPSHVANNDIFFFYYYFQMSYIIHFTAITISNKNLKNIFFFPHAIFCANMRACDFFRCYQDSNPQPQPHAYPSLPLGYTITCDQQWDIFLLSSPTAVTISNEKLFNYKVVDLLASYNFRLYFIFHLRSFENFENLKFKI